MRNHEVHLNARCSFESKHVGSGPRPLHFINQTCESSVLLQCQLIISIIRELLGRYPSFGDIAWRFPLFAFVMAAGIRNTPNPLLIPEIVGLVVDNIHMAPDLLNCACVNSMWNTAALKKLYRGSLNDMQFRTPDIGSLNCLFVASRKRFVRNMSFVRHLLLCPGSPAVDDAARPDTRLACFEKCRAMRHREYAEHLLRPRGSHLASLSIPFEIVDQDWSQISDLLLPTVEFLAIDNYYCKLLTASASYSRGLTTPTVSLQIIASLCFETMLTLIG